MQIKKFIAVATLLSASVFGQCRTPLKIALTTWIGLFALLCCRRQRLLQEA